MTGSISIRKPKEGKPALRIGYKQAELIKQESRFGLGAIEAPRWFGMDWGEMPGLKPWPTRSAQFLRIAIDALMKLIRSIGLPVHK